MASPVRLIRTMFGAIDDAIPGDTELAVLDATGLTQPRDPAETLGTVGRWVSITGDLDPIGGHFVRRKAIWAYMDVPVQRSIVDVQQLGGFGSSDTRRVLFDLLHAALSKDGPPPKVQVTNPHSWTGYVERHLVEIAGWILDV